ncbi:MAG: hypothetical protein Q6363_002300 [Candidatus Njordarchaeota archaeon]
MDNEQDFGLKEAIVIASFVWLLSYFIHAPTAFGGTWIYSDITGLLATRGIIYADRLLIPYIDYHFEYPPIVALLFILSNLAILVIPISMISLRWLIAYTVMSILLFLHAIGTVYLLFKLSKYTDKKPIRILLCFILAPSFLIFSNYNWDLVGIFYGLLGLYFFLENKRLLSFVSFGLAMAGKIIPGIIALAPVAQIFVEYIEKEKAKNNHLVPKKYLFAIFHSFKYLIVTATVFMVANLPFIILNFEAWYSGLILHHAGWYIEDSWLILIFSAGSPYAKIVSIALSICFTVITFLLLISKNIQKEQRIFYGSAAFMSGYLFSNYVYTPQMNLMLLPLLIFVPIEYVIIFVFDALNALIILTWFSFKNIYSLFHIDIDNPIHPLSIPQIAASIRCFLLLAILFMIYLEIIDAEKISKKGSSHNRKHQ